MDATSGEFRRRIDSVREELDYRLDLEGAGSAIESDPELERERRELAEQRQLLAWTAD